MRVHQILLCVFNFTITILKFLYLTSNYERQYESNACYSFYQEL
jgi:hypothetical protein